MFEDFAPKLARVLTEYSQPVQPGNKVVIVANPGAAPLIESLYEAVLWRGGYPIPLINLPGLEEIMMRVGTDEQLAFPDPVRLTAVQQADVAYFLYAHHNVKQLSTYPADRHARRDQGRRPYIETYRDRWAAGDLRWTITSWPTDAAAQHAEMGLLAYTEFIYRAGALDQPDPLAHWLAFRERHDRLIAWLDGKSHVEVKGPGVDLSFEVGGRKWINAHGDLNFPDGEIYTGPLEASVNGHIEFSYPTVYLNREVSGVKMTYKDGKVVEASAAKGEDYMLAKLDFDEGARHLGEFAIGTNYGVQKFTGDTLFDEKIGGTIHLAVGNSIPMTGGTNKSYVHWDMVHDMKQGGEIWVDGALFYRNGEFVVD